MAVFSGPEVVNDGLVLHLDAANDRSYSGSGTTWTDLSGNGNDGTLTNGPTFDSANKGGIDFDGVNEFVTLGTKSDLTFSSGGTICIFFKWSSYNGSSWSNTLIGRGGSSWINHHYILFKYSNTNKLHFAVSNGVSSTTSAGPRSTFDIELDTPYFVAITIDNPLKKMYINGELNSQVSNSVMPISTPTTVSLGRTGSSVYYLDGNIYNTMLYDRVLTADEIKQNFEATRSRYGI